MTDWLSKWIYAYNKQTYPNGSQKERPLWSQNIPKMEPSLATTDPKRGYRLREKY